MTASTIHASAVLCGHCGVLVRGPSGSGKSRLVLSLLHAAQARRFVRLIGDDRLHIENAHGRLLLRPAQALQGMIEIRGVGIRRMSFEPVAVAHLVVDLAAADAQRLPDQSPAETVLAGVTLARLAVAPGADALACLRDRLAFGPS